MSNLFITAYLKATGEKVTIPRQYLGHPVLGKPYAAKPPAPHTESAPKPSRKSRDSVDDTPATPAAPTPDTTPSAGEPDKEQS